MTVVPNAGMDPLVSSTLLSTGADLVGGLLGGKQKAPSWAPWMKAAVGPGNYKSGVNTLAKVQAFIDKTLLSSKMEAARENGIHPLVALGIPPSSVGGESYIGDVGPSASIASDMGQGIGRAVEAYATKDERALTAQLQKLAVERSMLENESLKSDVALKRAQLAPALPFGKAMIDGQGDTRYPEQHRQPFGYGDSAPMLRKGYDQHGNMIRTWNDDLGDNEVMQAATAIGYSLPDWFIGRAADWIGDQWYKRSLEGANRRKAQKRFFQNFTRKYERR